ncbi:MULTISPECIES: bacterial Ig-like domain-containing protein [unclassified Enterococcus]|uniref:bacterial Ig-like domain-containing protein n=1 Tax=unclassified Enterococcus TaxID=2608891 RepID=UPI0013E9BCA5|nr:MULTISPECIES: bacterial Ig-like domain-containing protein [unclassified Enterococcus]
MKRSINWFVTTSLLCSTVLFNISFLVTVNASTTNGTLGVSAWTTTVNGDTTILTGYTGKDKDVVIPLSGDVGTTNVKITKQALRQAATEADSQGGTLSTSINDSSGTGLVADNSTDDTPSDTIVDYSGTFKDLTKITKIDLSPLKIEAHDGANGQDVKGADGTTNGGKGEDVKGGDGQAGENIDVSSMFENCTSLKEVNLNSFVGQGGKGGKGGKGTGGNGYDDSTGSGGDGYGGKGGYAGNFNSQNMYEHTPQLVEIQMGSFVGQCGKGGKGGNGYGGRDCGNRGGNGYGNRGGNGYGGLGYIGGDGRGADGGNTDISLNVGGQGGGGRGGRGYGGRGGDGYGGNGGNSLDNMAGFGGQGYGGHSYGDRGGNGYGGNGGTALNAGDGQGGDGTGGQSGIVGGDGYGGKPDGASNAGKVNFAILPENLIGENLRLYQAYTGTTNKTNMFFPIAVSELALTKKVGFAPDELKENVGALRTTDSGKGENIRDSELGNVSLSAKDETGNAVDLADVSNQAGEYTLTYTYGGKSVDTHLTVKGGSITTQDLTLGTGDTWKPADNFVSAENENQQPIPFDQLTVTGADQVDLSKAGTYTVTYTYQDVSDLLKAEAKVNVIDIQTKSLVLDVGAPWQPYDALTSVTNVDQVEHTDQAYFAQHVTVSAIDKSSGNTIDSTQLSATPGTYTLTYTYEGISRSVDVLVEKVELADQSVLPSDIDFGNPPIQYEKDQILDGQTNGKPTENQKDVSETRIDTAKEKVYPKTSEDSLQSLFITVFGIGTILFISYCIAREIRLEKKN